MDIFWFVLNACFDFRVYYVVRWEISGCTYKVIVYTPNKAKTREADAHIRLYVHLLRLFLLC